MLFRSHHCAVNCVLQRLQPCKARKINFPTSIKRAFTYNTNFFAFLRFPRCCAELPTASPDECEKERSGRRKKEQFELLHHQSIRLFLISRAVYSALLVPVCLLMVMVLAFGKFSRLISCCNARRQRERQHIISEFSYALRPLLTPNI